MVYAYRAEGGFEPLDFYIPTGLKPAPRTLQAHPRSLYIPTILFIYPKNTHKSLIEIQNQH